MFEWLNSAHPVFTANVDRWERNENRLRGGDDVHQELVPFDWEEVTWDHQMRMFRGLAPGGKPLLENVAEWSHYELRRQQCTYMNFMDQFATTVVGHLTAKAPEADAGLGFGTLGRVARGTSRLPSRAELLYYNTDGVGNDGSQWDNWWAGVDKRAMATGHRWLMVESPTRRPMTFADELAGLRPYMVEYSPAQVRDWHFVQGRLAYAMVDIPGRNPRIRQGQMVTGEGDEKLLVVRRGYTALDDGGYRWSAGGWFRFDAGRELVDFGLWDSTDGEIPMWAHFYERDRGSKLRPAVSRPALTEHGQLGVSYMNLSSAADFDVWDAAKSEKFVMGADEEGWAIMIGQRRKGSTITAVPTNMDTGQVPTIYDGSTGAVVAGVFDQTFARKREEARQHSQQHITSTPDSSGRSKEAGFAEYVSPRLALTASEKERSQNIAIHRFEQRWGSRQPTGVVRWPRKYELAPLVDDVERIFTLEQLAQVSSRTLKAKAMVLAAQETGLITDDAEAEKVRQEYLADADARAEARQAERTLFGGV